MRFQRFANMGILLSAGGISTIICWIFHLPLTLWCDWWTRLVLGIICGSFGVNLDTVANIAETSGCVITFIVSAFTVYIPINRRIAISIGAFILGGPILMLVGMAGFPNC